MPLPLEDLYEDIIGKAQRGLGLSDAAIIQQAEISPAALHAAQSGQFDAAVARQLAGPLHLSAEALVACGQKSWHPSITSLPPCFWQLTTDYQGVMTVNAYVAAHPQSREALIFDSGADATPILDLLQNEGLSAKAILITHGHGDHITEIPKLQRELAVPVIAVASGVDGDQAFQWGETLDLAGFNIKCLRTSGHAADGTTFLFELEAQPIAITGDALFAGSMGGANDHWQEALGYTREHILTLPDPTILGPGHGPVTTVALEKAHNPFFA